MTVAVVFNYGFGNVYSMIRTLANLGVDTTLVSDYQQSLEADGLVVPDMGAFAACMEGLKKVDDDRVIYNRIRAGRPALGVCVGEQIMFERSLEHGIHAAGIGLISGSANLLDADVVPHMGWNMIEAAPDPVLFDSVENGRFYFVHSYAAMEIELTGTSRLDIDLSDSPERMSWYSYGRSRFVTAYEHGPLSVTQFHPEKPGDAGSQLPKNWVATL